MAKPTYSMRAQLLKKTKLGETDLIVTLLSQDGSQKRAVAKGARRPGGSFAGRLELSCEVDLLLNEGRGLDVVREARMVTAHPTFMIHPVQAACANAICEVCERITQTNLEHPRLYDMVHRSFSSLETEDEARALYVTAAALLKAFSFAGVAPHLGRCALCGCLLSSEETRFFSLEEGGELCATCAAQTDSHTGNAGVIELAGALQMATFDSIDESQADMLYALEVLMMCRAWCAFHIGSRLKSLDVLIELCNG